MHIDSNKCLVFFSTCILSEGLNRVLIIDTQRNDFITIPNSMNDVIKDFKKKKTINEVIELYGSDNEKIIYEYVRFLLEREYAFLANENEFDNFIELDNTFEIPSKITNCIIENPTPKNNIFKNAIEELNNLNCQNVQIVYYELEDIQILIDIIHILNNYDIRSIELIIPFGKSVLKFILENDNSNQKITDILVHNTPIEILKTDFKNFNISFITDKIENFKNCGLVETKYFNVNKYKILESINHNTCLNKKVTIDKEGNIKNCPAMIETFGSIKDISIKEVLNKTDFKKYWNITKDQIEICKDCEFRHVCTDCRAYLEKPDNQYSKPLKCGYNPATCQWEEWSNNPLKQKAIEFYGMQKLIKNSQFLDEPIKNKV